MSPVYITKTSSFLPNAPISNEEIEQVLGKLEYQPDRVKQFVLANNGIRHRHYAIDSATGRKTHTNAQLAARAIGQLFDTGAAERPLSVEGLACGTSSPDQLIPSHANMVAGELKLPPTEVVSMAGVCASGLAAFNYGAMSIRAGEAENFVVSGSECASAFMDKENFEPVVDHLVHDKEASPFISFEKEFLRWMLSDGAGSMLLEPAPREEGVNLRVESCLLRSWAGELPVCMYAGMNKKEDGSFVHWFEEKDRRLVMPKGYFLLQQDARVLQAHMVDVAVTGIQWLVGKTGIDLSDIDWFLPHLSSMYFKELLLERFSTEHIDLPEERWFTNLAERGNTGSASIYIMLDELVRSGRLQKGERIFCAVPESARFTLAGLILTVC